MELSTSYKHVKNRLYMSKDASINDDFEKQYYALRAKENRIYPDSVIRELPHTDPMHPYHREWQLRKKSATRICKYLSAKNKPLRILEIGCGNGWLSHQLSKIKSSNIIALDPCYLELEQASAVFCDIPNLQFIYGDLQSLKPGQLQFDIILFAASIQYFQSFDETLEYVRQLKSNEAEIHIIDTPFYKMNEISAAKERSKKYFERIGFPEMSGLYFHHAMDDLTKNNFKALYNPFAIGSYFQKFRNPFYWMHQVQ